MLASQFASIPHVHASSHGAGAGPDAAMPHVHLAIIDSNRQEHHRHAGHHHHHSQAARQDGFPTDHSPTPAHDSDAVYVHPFLLTTPVESHATANNDEATDWTHDLAVVAASSRMPTLLVTAWHLPPPSLRPNCRLYLGVQNLLL